ncbi:hypothetical protein JC795_30620 [Pseudomonas veronii]|nr:hypothetical protein [Pseudomonas veronii]
MEDAIDAGKPDTLIIDRANTASNRRESLRGIETKPGLDRDEYSPAMFQEGGQGASVRQSTLATIVGQVLVLALNVEGCQTERRFE